MRFCIVEKRHPSALNLWVIKQSETYYCSSQTHFSHRYIATISDSSYNTNPPRLPPYLIQDRHCLGRIAAAVNGVWEAFAFPSKWRWSTSLKMTAFTSQGGENGLRLTNVQGEKIKSRACKLFLSSNLFKIHSLMTLILHSVFGQGPHFSFDATTVKDLQGLLSISKLA